MVTPTLPRPPAPPVAEVHYPESDGQPVAETDVHRQLMFELISMLQAFFRADPHVYISGNLFLYYQEGNPRRVVAPDVFVVPGIPNEQRRIYKLWEEGVVPAVVFELTSRSTRREDLRNKYDLYERLGVREYFLFDPLDEYLRPPLQGYHLHQGRYRPLAVEADGALWSAALGLALHPRGEQLRLYDPERQRWLPMPQEEEMARRAAEERASVEADARQAAEEQASVEADARQAAEERAGAEATARQAAEERAGVEADARQAAEQRATVEADARRVAESQMAAAEAELARLRALLSSRGQSS